MLRSLYCASSCDRVFRFLTNVQCHNIEKFTDLECSGCTGKYQTSRYCRIDLAIAWSIQQDLDRFNIFPRYKLL